MSEVVLIREKSGGSEVPDRPVLRRAESNFEMCNLRLYVTFKDEVEGFSALHAGAETQGLTGDMWRSHMVDQSNAVVPCFLISAAPENSCSQTA